MVQRQESPSNGMEVDDEEDGLPKTQEANDIIVRQKSGELDKIDAPDPISSSFQIADNKNSKSRSFAEHQPARKSIKLFGNSFGKGSREGKKQNHSFMSVNAQNVGETNKLSARSNNSARFRPLYTKDDVLSQVSESYDQSYKSQLFERNEVDLELLELMKQSQSQALMDECAFIERISSADIND